MQPSVSRRTATSRQSEPPSKRRKASSRVSETARKHFKHSTFSSEALISVSVRAARGRRVSALGSASTAAHQASSSVTPARCRCASARRRAVSSARCCFGVGKRQSAQRRPAMTHAHETLSQFAKDQFLAPPRRSKKLISAISRLQLTRERIENKIDPPAQEESLMAEPAEQ